MPLNLQSKNCPHSGARASPAPQVSSTTPLSGSLLTLGHPNVALCLALFISITSHQVVAGVQIPLLVKPN